MRSVEDLLGVGGADSLVSLPPPGRLRIAVALGPLFLYFGLSETTYLVLCFRGKEQCGATRHEAKNALRIAGWAASTDEVQCEQGKSSQEDANGIRHMRGGPMSLWQGAI
jgi:hypothetical protein